MPQLSLYVTQDQLLKIENEARAEKMILSKWGVSKIMERIEPHYPDGWVDLFGSVSENKEGSDVLRNNYRTDKSFTGSMSRRCLKIS